MRTAFAVLSALLLGSTPIGTTTANADPAVRVVDGDSLVVDGQRVRLFGIDAPELLQTCSGSPCGLAAKAALERIIGHDAVTCVERDRDRYGRSVAQCSTLGGDLGSRMVASGHAVAYRRYSTIYVAQEGAARAAGLGIWAAEFTLPETYRHQENRR